MNRSTLIALIISLFSAIIVFLTFSYGNTNYLDTLLVTLLLSSPLFIISFILVMFCRSNFRVNHPILNKIAISAFIFTALLHICWNSFMLLDVSQRGDLGPGQGYSGLILWFGSIKTVFLGSAVGMFIHYTSLLFRKLISK
ncbi:hypothetical protein DI392_15890 [Vibrio albus]|uniref:Uncharacterized protein n=1 Tax=Vibrio albus TaxID=2200953 RepID=A0A2U3B6W4_9VIBR|nr:hypothetical protein DI392_15890 [Vibrio albus]